MATAKVAAQLAGRPQADTASDAAAAAQRRGVGPGAYGPAWGKEGSGVGVGVVGAGVPPGSAVEPSSASSSGSGAT